MSEQTTPLEREILTHYWTRPGPYLGDTEKWTALHREVVSRFIGLGLLIIDDSYENVRADQDALRAYMDALASVPLPEKFWVVPLLNATYCGTNLEFAKP